MALQLNVISDEGVVTNYHKIEEVSLRNGQLSCIVDSYVSREYRELSRPANSQFFIFETDVEEEESMGIRQLAYKKIKELPEWSEAVDC